MAAIMHWPELLRFLLRRPGQREAMNIVKAIVIVCGVSLLGLPAAWAQPLLREGNVDDDAQAEPDDEELERRALARRKAEHEEERLMKQQEELMRMQGELLLAERGEIERKQRIMRYALMIALLVIGTTLLMAYARSRVSEESNRPPVPPSPPSPGG
jgi:hypothetical protein